MALTNIEQRIKGGEKSICNTCAHNKVCRYMDNQPCIECSQYAEQERHGRWVMTLYATTSKRGRVISNKRFACSECGYSNGRKQSNYCPNCGAKMDLKEERP